MEQISNSQEAGRDERQTPPAPQSQQSTRPPSASRSRLGLLESPHTGQDLPTAAGPLQQACACPSFVYANNRGFPDTRSAGCVPEAPNEGLKGSLQNREETSGGCEDQALRVWTPNRRETGPPHHLPPSHVQQVNPSPEHKTPLRAGFLGGCFTEATRGLPPPAPRTLLCHKLLAAGQSDKMAPPSLLSCALSASALPRAGANKPAPLGKGY